MPLRCRAPQLQQINGFDGCVAADADALPWDPADARLQLSTNATFACCFAHKANEPGCASAGSAVAACARTSRMARVTRVWGCGCCSASTKAPLSQCGCQRCVETALDVLWSTPSTDKSASRRMRLHVPSVPMATIFSCGVRSMPISPCACGTKHKAHGRVGMDRTPRSQAQVCRSQLCYAPA